jgi:hypothetical protein
MPLNLTDRELATVLAPLHYWQEDLVDNGGDDLSAGNCARVECDKHTARDQAVKVLPGYFGRCDRRAQRQALNRFTPCNGSA